MLLIQTFLPMSNTGPNFCYNMAWSPESRNEEYKAATASYINGTAKK